MSMFDTVTPDELVKVIQKSPSKSYELDCLPTWLLKATINVHLPVLTRIVNISMHTGTVLSSSKTSIVTPLLKKPTVDINDIKNYLPVSNLSFVGKVTERIVRRRLLAHINTNGLDETYQSAYRARHSTETALMKVHNDIAGHLDNNEAVLLVMLDLSAAFDTINH